MTSCSIDNFCKIFKLPDSTQLCPCVPLWITISAILILSFILILIISFLKKQHEKEIENERKNPKQSSTKIKEKRIW